MPSDKEKTIRIRAKELAFDQLSRYFEASDYLRVPAKSKKTDQEAEGTTWRIVLISLNSQHDPLALEIYDTITIGRSLGNSKVDLDLTHFMALQLGVSREHASLRPTENNLLLYDLNSTNGTFCNFKSASMNSPIKVDNNDILSFGALNFQVKIVSQPPGTG